MMKWNFNQLVSDYEIGIIKQALAETRIKAHAARLLGLNRTTLLAKMQKFGLSFSTRCVKTEELGNGEKARNKLSKKSKKRSSATA